jgi:hypothetical protein
MAGVLAAVDYGQGIQDAWSRVTTFVPKFVAFLLILVIGIFVAKAIAKAIDKVLERVGFDGAVERGGIKKALESSKYDASDIVGKVVYYALALIVLQLAFGVFGANPVSRMIEGVVAYLPKVFAAIVIVVVACAIAAAVKDLIGNALSGLSYGKTLANTTSIAVVAVGAFMALNQLQIAPAIVNGLFYAVLAIIVGSAVIAIGGGGIQPMRAQWEKAMGRLEEEGPRVREQMEIRRNATSTVSATPPAATPAANGNGDKAGSSSTRRK